jgi:hypothetical protein
LRSGKFLFGKDGTFAPLMKDIPEAALTGEIAQYSLIQGRFWGTATKCAEVTAFLSMPL